MTEPTFSLVLTAAQAHQLFRLVSIGELALAEHYRNGLAAHGTRRRAAHAAVDQRDEGRAVLGATVGPVARMAPTAGEGEAVVTERGPTCACATATSRARCRIPAPRSRKNSLAPVRFTIYRAEHVRPRLL